MLIWLQKYKKNGNSQTFCHQLSKFHRKIIMVEKVTRESAPALGKPAAFNPLALFENFADAPEATEGNHREHRLPKQVDA